MNTHVVDVGVEGSAKCDSRATYRVLQSESHRSRESRTRNAINRGVVTVSCLILIPGTLN